MNNLNEYNEFIKKYRKINEEVGKTFTTNPGSYGGSIGDQNTYFANVQGNLAGAENTLVGSAVIKLFGFIKRKGMQIYIKTILKPRLGKILMNGVLRYAIKHEFIGPRKKESFGISKVEGELEVAFDNKVIFQNGEQKGLSCMVVGATVNTEKETPILVDGEYVCLVNGVHFVVKDKKITSVGSVDKEDTTETQVQTPVQTQTEEIVETDDDELAKERTEYEKQLIDGTLDMEPSDDIKQNIEYVNSILKQIADETSASGLSDENKKVLTDLYNSLVKSVNDFNTFALGDIEKSLKKYKDLTNPKAKELLYYKQMYMVDIKELIILRDKVKVFLKKNSGVSATGTTAPKTTAPKVVAENVYSKYNQFLYEKQAVVNVADKTIKTNKPTVSRLGDELKELSDRGEAVDLNDENFYKQFESSEIKKAVSLEILTEKSSLVKLQLTAENIIAGGVTTYGAIGGVSDKNRWKLENYWKKSVEDVLGRYSKFMVTDAVNPYKIIKESSSSEVEKWRVENNNIGSAGNQVKSAAAMYNADNNTLFKDSTTLVSELNKIGKGDYCILKLGLKSGTSTSNDVYLLKRSEGNIYKFLGKIDFEKITPDFKESDFKSIVQQTYPKFILPTSYKIESLGLGFRGMYIVSGTKDNFSSGEVANKISIVYLYSKTETIDWNDKDSYTFKIKYFKGIGEDRPFGTNLSTLVKEDKPFYKLEMFVDKSLKYKISSSAIGSFGEFKDYDIMKAKDLFDLYKTNLG